MTSARTSNTWAENLEQVGYDYADGLCSYEAGIERLMRECDFSLEESAAHLACFSPPAEEAA